jgi:uncharacterized metal-binding protein
MSNAQECSGGDTLIFSCSGAADVGAISDQAARKMTRDGVGKMFCLAGVGGRVEGIVQKTKAASRVVAIDGCPLDCTKKCLEQAGITNFAYLRVTDLGLEKGASPATDENVAQVAEAASALLA